MRYQIHAAQFEDDLVEVDVPGVFAKPLIYQNNRPAHQHFSDKSHFVVKVNDQQYDLDIILPILESTIKVKVDGKPTVLNQHQSVLARSCVFIPLAALALCLVFTTLHWAWCLLLTLPFALLSTRALRLSPLSKKRNAVLVMGVLFSIGAVIVGTYPLLPQNGLAPAVSEQEVSSVFYEVVIPDDLPMPYTRDSLVALLETFRLTQPFQTLQSELLLLDQPPSLDTSLYQSTMPKQNRALWIVRFDMTTEELGPEHAQRFVDGLGNSFERFVDTIERQ